MNLDFRFVLLDFGHPMKCSTMKNILNSLENTLTLGLTFPGHTKRTYFGISFLNSDFTVLESEWHLRENYETFSKNMNILLEKIKNKGKVTVPEYKHFLSSSIEAILRTSQEKLKGINSCGQSKSAHVKVAILTKKTASILMDILTDVANKVSENLSVARLRSSYKIVQILNEQDEKTQGTSDKCAFIKWMTCTDDGGDLNNFVKDWFLNQREKLQIILSKDLDLILQCDVDNFLINPLSMVSNKECDLNNVIDILNPVSDLEIINRIPVDNLCPTLVFGIPHRVRATRNASSWVESQTNIKMFQELCRQLHQTRQGLLAKSMAKAARDELIAFHFLTSDGHMLLMNNVAPEELYLPKRVKSSKLCSGHDESASSLIRSCIQKIKFLNEYSPANYSSGLCRYMRSHLSQNERNASSCDTNVKLLGRKCRKKGSPSDENSEKPKKKSKPDPKKELQNIHPALLPPQVVEKYRKVPSDVFNLLELGEDYNDSFA